MDNLFVNALVRAGSCREHSNDRCKHSSWRPATSPTLRRRQIGLADGARNLHLHTSSNCQALAQHIDVSPDEYKRLVDFYDEEVPTTNATPSNEPGVIPTPPPLVVAGVGVEKSSSTHQAWPAGSEIEQKAIRRLAGSLLSKYTPHETIYELYKALPSPRVPYLSRRTIRLLLHRLSVVERKTEASMLRYLSVVDDMKIVGIPLTTGEWSSAIAFVGRCFSRVSQAEIESALYLWKEMEGEAGVKSSTVTFNILFDVAAKAGKFALAEMILVEMQSRGLELDRYARVGLIYYYGLKGDGDGVRRAYRELVDAGEIVDTVVLNCVIAALVKAGEPAAAEQVYERMKVMHRKRSGAPLPPRDWRGAREISKLLRGAAKAATEEPEHYEKLQRKSSVAPDLQTYRILAVHHAVCTGELEHLAKLLAEMQFFRIPLHGSIFLALFKGFSIHGGVRYTTWTRSRLESVWSSYRSALDDQVEQLYLGKWIVIWSLRSFARCAGKQRTLEVWEEIKERWTPRENEMEAVVGVLGDLLSEQKVFSRLSEAEDIL
jgi:pentatricopeptide repeat protein